MPIFVELLTTCSGTFPLLLGLYTMTPLNSVQLSAISSMLTPSGKQSSGIISTPLALARIIQS